MGDRVLCVSAGLLSPKKRDSPLARQHLYLNYGLLGLATILSEAGYEARVVHGRFERPDHFVESLASQNLLPSQAPVLLSVPSNFALPWARAFCRALRSVNSQSRIIVGGRWVVADDEAWIRNQIPEADVFVRGTAERRILDLVRGSTDQVPIVLSSDGTTPERALEHLPHHDFRLVDRFEDFQPAVEVSRGCRMGCGFCAEANVPLSSMKDPLLVAAELANLTAVYGSSDIHPYLQASYFKPSPRWCRQVGPACEAVGVAVRWRAETRVDGLSPKMIADLARSGLAVLDLGLESASPGQLLAMEKTTVPVAYLKRASELLQACADHGVWAKVNVLLHPGESSQSLEETSEWLEKHRASIKGVSVGPVIVYRFGSSTVGYLNSLERFGAYPVEASALEAQGYVHLHLSPEIDHGAAQEHCRILSRRFMSSEDYFALKSFSYFPRQFDRGAFEMLVRETDEAALPFSLAGRPQS